MSDTPQATGCEPEVTGPASAPTAGLVGVLALQGDFVAHEEALSALGHRTRRVRRPDDLRGLDGIVLPGGESSTMLHWLDLQGLTDPLRLAIAAGLPNAKQYYWSVDPNTPREIYLRLEVRDEAGNTTEHQLVEPISTTGLVPKAFIRSVRPVTDQPREAFLRNRFYQPR